MTSSAEVGHPHAPAAVGLDASLAAAGLNVAGVLRCEQFDALVPAAWRSQVLLPGATSVFVIGSGGPRFYRAAREAWPTSQHPLDEFCEQQVAGAARTLEADGHATRTLYYWQRLGENDRDPGEFADFVGLARAAGLGALSRLGLLLHPSYGPWFAIRALLVSDCPVPDRMLTDDTFDPCPSCRAPCVAACRGAAVSHGRFSGERCMRARVELAECRERCDARSACVLGTEHRYGAEAVSHHATASFRGVAPK